MKYPPLIFSTGDVRKTIIRRVGKRIKKCEANDFVRPFTIIDAGCGVGTLLIPLAKHFPEHNFVGIEWSFLPYLIAKFRSKKVPNLKIVKQDMFSYDFKDANIIICFLLKSLMPRFTAKVIKEVSKKSYVYSNRFELDNCQTIETIDWHDNFSYIHIYKFLPKEKNK